MELENANLSNLSHPNASSLTNMRETQAITDTLQQKLRSLVEEFVAGTINRAQFQELYTRYQRQLQQVLQLSLENSNLTSDEAAIETTFHIKKRLTARVLGVSVYSNMTGLPIETLGEFNVDPALLVPMMSSYRDATREIFKAGMRSTAMENGQYLCFVPGQFSTLIALFSVEPAQLQMANLEQMHRDFEQANEKALRAGNVDPSLLAYPFLSFVQQVKARYSETQPKKSRPLIPHNPS